MRKAAQRFLDEGQGGGGSTHQPPKSASFRFACECECMSVLQTKYLDHQKQTNLATRITN